MATQHIRLSPSNDEVVSKVIDGEAIIINLSNGVYYSMANVGADVWNLIELGMCAEEIVTDICSRYTVDRSQVETDLDQLLTELATEKLVIESPGAAEHSGLPEREGGEKLDYETPQLQIYRDMGDLLALDPPQPGFENTPWKEAGDGSSSGELE